MNLYQFIALVPFLLLALTIPTAENASKTSSIPNLHKPTTTNRKPVTYFTEPHAHQVTKSLKTTPHYYHCHSFNPFCIPCKIAVNLIRTLMDRIVFVHKAVENICTDILGRHFLCDSLIRVTMFYLDHTPTNSVCKRLFLCQNDGLFDWWNFKSPYAKGTNNYTIWKILNSRDNFWEQEEYETVQGHVLSFFDNPANEVRVHDLPNLCRSSVVELLLAIKRSAENLENF